MKLIKEKSINLIFSKGSETLDEFNKVQHSPLIKTSLGNYDKTYKIVKSSTNIGSYLNAVKGSSQHHFVLPQKNKGPNTSQVKSSCFNQNDNDRRYYAPR